MSNTPTSSAQVAEGLNLEAERAEFEAFLGLNGAYKFRNTDGSYQVIDTQRAWFIWQAARRAAPVAEGVALPPLPKHHGYCGPHKTFHQADMHDYARSAVAPYAERIRQLERELKAARTVSDKNFDDILALRTELATFKGEHATQLATKSIEEDARFQCLLYHYVVARQKLADGRISEKEATDAFRELIARIDGRTAGPAVPEELVEIGNRMATTLEVLATALKNPGTAEGVRCTVEEWRAAVPKPQEDA